MSRRPPSDPLIGGPLRQLLAERWMTQKELADQIGVEGLTVSRWVRNEHAPFRRHVRMIAEALGVEPSTLIDRAAQHNGTPRKPARTRA